MTEITDIQADYIIQNGEIPAEIICSAEKVAVILTQNWCPQWLAMQFWLPKVDPDIHVYYLCYNRKPYSAEFMETKETSFANDLIPYLRYYSSGRLINESNYVDRELFLYHLNQD